MYGEQALELAQSLGNGRIHGFALTNLGHALLGLGETAVAANAYQQAYALRHQLGEAHLAVDPLAGLARISLAENDLEYATAHVETILNYIAEHGLTGTEEPARIYLTCYQELKASKDARAQDILTVAYQQLQAQAAKISDKEKRRDFLEKVAAHQAVVVVWEKVSNQ
jgi:hypothetical protein